MRDMDRHTAALVVHQTPARRGSVVSGFAPIRTVPHEGDEAPSSHEPITQLATVAGPYTQAQQQERHDGHCLFHVSISSARGNRYRVTLTLPGTVEVPSQSGRSE